MVSRSEIDKKAAEIKARREKEGRDLSKGERMKAAAKSAISKIKEGAIKAAQESHKWERSGPMMKSLNKFSNYNPSGGQAKGRSSRKTTKKRTSKKTKKRRASAKPPWMW